MNTDDARAVADCCRALIDIESVSRNEAAIEAYIRQALPSSFEVVYAEDSVVLAAKPRRPDRELVVIAGHTDTVPVENNFPSRVENNVIYGRGAADMKAGLAVMIELARWVDTNNIETDFDLGFLFFGREELAASECPLLGALEHEAFADTSLAILMEPTDNAIEAGCMGNLNLTVTFSGVAAHSARPWQGTNAVHRAIAALDEFAARQPVDVEIDGLVFKEVASITQVRGGVALNVIPAQFEADVNIRYAPSHDSKAVETEWLTYFTSLGATATVTSNAPPAPVVLDHPLVKQLRAAGATKTQPKQAWTNAADFAHHGIAAINFGPGDPFFAHKQDEQVTTDALQLSFDALKRFVQGISA